MRKHVWQPGLLFVLAAVMGGLSGCGQRVTDNPQPVQVQTETQAKVTEAVTETETKKETETHKETETEPPMVMELFLGMISKAIFKASSLSAA